MKLGSGINVHLSEMYCKLVELADLQYKVEDVNMVEYMLNSLPNQDEFNTLQEAIRYGAEDLIMKPDDVRERIRMVVARQSDQHKEQQKPLSGRNDRFGCGRNNEHEKRNDKKFQNDYHKGGNADRKFACHGCGSRY